MEKSKLFSLLNHLKDTEVLAFHKYLKKVYSGEGNALKVFEYIRKLYPKPWDKKKLDITYAYRKIFGAEITAPKNRKNMLNTLSNLHQWLKEFLITEKVRQDHFANQMLWLSILQKKGMKEDFSRQVNLLYEATMADDSKNYLNEIAVNFLQYQNLSQNANLRNISSMQRCMERLEMHFEIIRLKMTCEIATLQRVRPSKSEPEADARRLEAAESAHDKSPTLLDWYGLIRQLIETQSEEYYNRLEGMLVRYADQLDTGELHGIISYLQNYAAQQVRTGKEAVFGKKLHLLNQISAANNVFAQVEVMSLTQFTNIVNTATSVKDFEWAASFIDEHNHLLPADIRPFTVTLSNAIILFDQKKHREVIDMLKPSDIRHIHYSIRSRSLVLRSHYELGSDIDDVLNYYIAFEVFLARNRKPETGAVEATLGFLKVYKMLLLRKVEKKVILDHIEKTPSLYFKNWLLEKAATYKKR